MVEGDREAVEGALVPCPVNAIDERLFHSRSAWQTLAKSTALGTMATLNLGAEHDIPLRASVRAALRSLGAKRVEKSWGVGGSQELSQERWRLGDATLLLEAETYIGLTLEGPEDLVQRVAAAIGLPAS